MKIIISPVAEKINLDRGYTDFIKVMCCLLVAASHYAQNYIINSHGEYNLFLSLLSTQGGYIGVSFFFFLSGYGLMCSQLVIQDSFFRFVKRRMSKVYFPAIYVSIIWLILLVLFPILQQDANFSIDMSGWGLLKNLGSVFLLNFFDSVLWFVKVILALYIVLYIYVRLSKSRYYYIRLLYLALVTWCVTALTYYMIAPFASVSVPVFTCGILVAEFNKRISDKIIFYSFTVIAIICLLGLWGRDNHILLHGVINYLLIILWLLVSYFFSIQIKGFPAFLTNCSYDVYITHKKVLLAMNILYGSFSLLTFMFIAILVAIIEYYSRRFIKL